MVYIAGVMLGAMFCPGYNDFDIMLLRFSPPTSADAAVLVPQCGVHIVPARWFVLIGARAPGGAVAISAIRRSIHPPTHPLARSLAHPSTHLSALRFRLSIALSLAGILVVVIDLIFPGFMLIQITKSARGKVAGWALVSVGTVIGVISTYTTIIAIISDVKNHKF